MFIEQETLNPNKKITCSKPDDTCRNYKAVLIKHDTFVLKSIVSNGSSKISLYLKKWLYFPNHDTLIQTWTQRSSWNCILTAEKLKIKKKMNMKIISLTIAPLYLHLPLYPLCLLSLPLFLWLCSPPPILLVMQLPPPILLSPSTMPFSPFRSSVSDPPFSTQRFALCSWAKRLLPVQLGITTTVRWNKNG